MARLPAALVFRLVFAGSGVAADSGFLDSAFIAAHLFFWPSAMRRRAAALTLRFRVGVSGVVVSSVLAPDNMARSSPIWVSIRLFCDSKPSMAAAMISAFSFGVGMGIRARFRSVEARIHCTSGQLLIVFDSTTQPTAT